MTSAELVPVASEAMANFVPERVHGGLFAGDDQAVTALPERTGVHSVPETAFPACPTFRFARLLYVLSYAPRNRGLFAQPLLRIEWF